MSRRPYRWTFGAASAAILLTALSACGGSSSGAGNTASASSKSDKPIVIGVSETLSGPAAGIGKIFDTSTKYWESLGTKILGRPVHVVVRDDKGTADGGASVAREFIDQDHVNFVVGPFVSDPAQAELPLFKQANILTVTAAAFGDAHDPSKYPLVFPIQFSVDDTAELLKNGLEKLGITKVGVLAGNNAFGQALSQSLKTAMSGSSATIVSTQFFEPLATDVTTQLGKLKSAGAQIVVVLSVIAPDAVTTMKGLDVIHWPAKILIANPPDPASWSAVPAADASRGLAVSVTQNMTNPVPDKVAQFRDSLEKYLNTSTISAARLGQYAYYPDAFNLIAWAAQGANSIQSSAMKSYIESQGSYSGLSADYKFSASQHAGIPVEQGPVVVVSSFKNGIYDRAQ